MTKLRYIIRIKYSTRQEQGIIVITALMFTLGKYLLALYLGRLQVSLVFGASGSIVAILIWAYYSAQIFFVGAEMIKLFMTGKVVINKY